MKLVPKFTGGQIRRTVPGKDVSIGITMTPLTPCESLTPCDPARVIDADGTLVKELGCGEEYQLEPCSCAPIAVGWTIQPTKGQTYLLSENGADYERHTWIQPELVDAYIEDPDGAHDTNDAGRPAVLRMNSLPPYGDFTEATPPAYTNPHQSWLFLGLPFGDSNSIRWEWEWDISSELPTKPWAEWAPEATSWWTGHETEQVGNFIQVRIKHGFLHADDPAGWSANLTARAFCGDEQVGELNLHILMPVGGGGGGGGGA